MKKQCHGVTAIYTGAATVGPEDVTYPVPQRQIDLSNGLIVTEQIRFKLI